MPIDARLEQDQVDQEQHERMLDERICNASIGISSSIAALSLLTPGRRTP
jgi:hypothetical protein